MSQNIESLQKEDRVFAPPAEFSAKSHVKSMEEYEALHRRSLEDPEGWWSERAATLQLVQHTLWRTGDVVHAAHPKAALTIAAAVIKAVAGNEFG